jgi:hypothetical protein
MLKIKQWTGFLNDYGTKKGAKITVGGTQYDITKMSKKERKQHSFDGKDPMDEMEPLS